LSLTEITLSKKQMSFVLSKARFSAFIGGRGSGKSFAGCVKCIHKALTNPGCHIMVTAPTYPQLRDSTKTTLLELLPRELIAYKNDAENNLGIICPNGEVSHIHFRSTSDPDTLRGANLLAVFMDEASMSTEEALRIVLGCIRTGAPEDQQLWVTTTPKGMNWIYKWFGPARPPENDAFYATSMDNPTLGQDYFDSMLKMYSGAFLEQEVYGKFVPYEGLIYGDLIQYDKHIGDFFFDEEKPVHLAWDFGYPNTTAILAIQQNGNGQITVIDEVYQSRLMDEDAVAIIRAKPYWNNISYVICDEARPDSILRLKKLGLPARESNKGKILDGINKVRALLKIDPATGQPSLRINRRCDGLIKEFEQYKWADRRIDTDEWKEKPIDEFNHALDALRYWVVTIWNPRPVVKVGDRKAPAKRIQAWQRLDQSPFRY
jgi:phage terminase large subunit